MSVDPRPFMFLEAISSVALSHKANCRCLTCRAADGDKQAFAELYELINNPLAERIIDPASVSSGGDQ